MNQIYDIIVLGGGHAGLEAAHISSTFNLSVGLFILPGVKIASAPCNPSIGGVGKGQVVREIDALGGVMGTNPRDMRFNQHVFKLIKIFMLMRLKL